MGSSAKLARLRVRAAPRAAVEVLESRQLMTVGSAPALFDSTSATSSTSSSSSSDLATVLAQPSVVGTTPAESTTNVLRDAFVSVDLNVPNGGIDKATLSTATVK